MQAVKNRGFLESGKVTFISVDDICPNPAQPRKIFESEGMRELASSIQQFGVLQPLSVRRKDSGYELIAGERRLRAAKMVGLTEVPCIFLGIDDEQSSMISLVENLQRKDLDFIEEAEGLARLMRLYGLSQEEAALRIGKSQSAVANKLRLLRHSPKVLQVIRENNLTERHARALLKVEGEEDRLKVLEYVIKHQLNVAATEKYIEVFIAPKKEDSKKRTYVLKDVRMFLNTIKRSMEIMNSAGISAECGREETEKEIVLTITIPKKT